MSKVIDDLFGNKITEDNPAEAPGGIAELARVYLRYRAVDEDIAARLKAAIALTDAAKSALMVAMEQAHLPTVRLKTGEQLIIGVKHVFALPPKSDPENRLKALAWLRRVGAKDLVEEAINPQTLTKFLRERVDGGKEVNSLIKDTPLSTLSVRGR